MRTSYFITGTDTGIGKTLISCALLRHLITYGWSTVGMKPISAGCSRVDDVLVNEDVVALKAASSIQAPAELINPYLFEAAIAPHIAAEESDVRIELNKIGRAFVELSKLADVVIVEGVGGFLVPLNDCQNTAEMARMLNLPVILVVGMRLGCLNHALLTQDAITSRGLKLAGWVANCITPEMPRLEANIEALQKRLHAPLIATVPYMEKPDVSQIRLVMPFEKQ